MTKTLEMKKLLLPLLLLFTSMLLSQSKVDSLQMEYHKASEDTIRIKILHHLSAEYSDTLRQKNKEALLQAILLSKKTDNGHLRFKSYNLYGDFLYNQSEFDSAITTYKIGLELAKNIGYTKGQSASLLDIGDTYLRKGNFDKAIDYQRMNIALAEKIEDEFSIASSYNSMGLIHLEKNEYTTAMELFTVASKKFLALDHLEEYSITLANIGLIQRELGNGKSAITYFQRADSIFKRLNLTSYRAFALDHLSIIHKDLRNLNQAISYSTQAYEIYEVIGNQRGMAMSLNGLANIYFLKEDYNRALQIYLESLDIFEKIGDSIYMAYSYNDLGKTYNKLKDIVGAKNFLKQAVQVSKDINLDVILMNAQADLARIYADEGNYEKAYESSMQFGMLRDSIYTKEKRELASEIEAKYQNEQKAKEITSLSTAKDLQALLLEKRINERNVLIGLALIILLISGLLFNQFRIKQKANKRLKELDKLKSNFFANISHEFRTPLTLISGPIEQLEQNPNERLSIENIKMIRRNANRVLKMVTQLLDLSRIDEGNLKMEPTEGDVYKCLRAASSSFNSHAAQRNMDYRVEIPSTVLWASFDRDKLENIVYNLLGNAFKFSEDGSKISFVTDYNEGALLIKVSDTGRGIAIDKLPFIFDRFYQAESGNTREKGGSGLGLSFSKDLVELMDGTITVSSKVDQGTLFTVQLPFQEIRTRQKGPVGDVPQMGESLVKRPFDLLSTDKRNLPAILLIEDNADMRHFIREHLEKFYKVIEAVNGEAGLQKAKADSPDLIITDLMMPKMDGIELCKKIKTDVHTCHIPVIMLTAKAGIENKIEGLETGADDYLTKPFDGKELLVRTKNLIEQRQKLRELYGNKEIQLDPGKITATSIDQKFLEQVLELLEINFSDVEFGVPHMQDALAMSKTQLHRKLKALTNEAPGEVLRNFRLKRAAQLLSQKEDSVTQIAYKVGFNNLSYFAKCFKELYGVAPSSY
jgi:signal transduction histidine kinase/DNA-binding response OmpR family regulator/Tfp pilus assembly protein PilF